MNDEIVAAILAVLEAHTTLEPSWRGSVACQCGETFQGTHNDAFELHRAHVAQVLASWWAEVDSICEMSAYAVDFGMPHVPEGMHYHEDTGPCGGTLIRVYCLRSEDGAA